MAAILTFLQRRLSFLAAALALGACAILPSTGDDRPPIIFLHGHSDTAFSWRATIWRFESNGWDRTFLHPIDFPNPLSRDDEAKPQSNRNSVVEQRQQLAATVTEVRRLTGRAKVVLIGHSAGGLVIRDYVKNGGGAPYVSHAILGGTPNHGVSDWDETRGSRFNAKGAFLTQLNAGPNEVVAGVRFMTIRSDANDRFAQPDGRFLGKPGKPTHVAYDSPELKGAENMVFAGFDHRETAFHPLAFAEMHRFITGKPPARMTIVAEREVVLNGKITGMDAGTPTNLPVAGARIEVYEVSPETGERIGSVLHSKITEADGLWGPFVAKPDCYYEFVFDAPGHAINHIYQLPFPRSSDILHFRPRDFAKGEETVGSVVMIHRLAGYFRHARDIFEIDGKVPGGIAEGVPVDLFGKILLPPGPLRAVPTRFNDERITVRNWPAKDRHIVVAQFHF